MHSGAGCLQGQGTAGLPRCDCQGVGGHDEVRLCARGCAWATCPHSAHRCRAPLPCFPPSTCVMPAAEIQWPCRYCARGIALVFGHQPTSPVRASEPSELICKGQVCRSLGSLNERIYRDTVWFIRMLRLGESSACPRSFCFWSDAYIHSPQTLNNTSTRPWIWLGRWHLARRSSPGSPSAAQPEPQARTQPVLKHEKRKCAQRFCRACVFTIRHRRGTRGTTRGDASLLAGRGGDAQVGWTTTIRGRRSA